jgi:hypothetical protein
MSVDPSFVRPARGSPFAAAARDGQPEPGMPEIRCVEVLPLRAGDRLIIHVDGSVGMSAGGAGRAGGMVREILKLDELGFDVPMLVVSPGFRVEVARPS